MRFALRGGGTEAEVGERQARRDPAMRCAAAAYDVLAQVGVVKKRSKFGNVFANFYPKLMRKRMLRDATEKGLKVVRRQGRASRKWKKD